MSTTTRPTIGTRIAFMNDLFLLEEDTILVDFNGSGTTYHVAENVLYKVHVAIFNPYAERAYTVEVASDYGRVTANIPHLLDMRIVFIPSEN